MAKHNSESSSVSDLVRMRLTELIDKVLSSNTDFDGFLFEFSMFWAALSIDLENTGPLAGDLHALLWQIRHRISYGKPAFRNIRIELDSWLSRTLVVERVYAEENSLRKLVVKLSTERQLETSGAIQSYQEHPYIAVFDNAVSIDNRNVIDFPYCEEFLEDIDLFEFFSNKQTLIDNIRENKRKDSRVNTFLRKTRLNDAICVSSLYRRVLMGDRAGLYHASRATHPFEGPILHILPRLLDLKGTESALRYICSSLSDIKRFGFESVLLGCVDSQTVNVYYGEDDRGVLKAYPNNHGYWSSGKSEIDPRLGMMSDYVLLTKMGTNEGIDIFQDTVLGTLGYPAQVQKLSAIENLPDAMSLHVGEDIFSACDNVAFLHDVCIDEENSLGESVEPELYGEVISQSHFGSPFALPKLNLFDPAILRSSLIRAKRQMHEAGIFAFRLDMAKHIGLSQLKECISLLREYASESSVKFPDFSCKFRILLEYWSVKYRDLKIVVSALQQENASIYFYDFPLAQATRQVFVHNRSFVDEVSKLTAERNRWGIHPFQLIPTFIDHDFSFRPIYNGSEQSCAIVIVGFALCVMLSANAPYVYFGFDKSAAGSSNLENHTNESEYDSRRYVSRLFSVGDENSPLMPLADILSLYRSYPELKIWDEDRLLVYGDDDNLVIRRSSTSVSGELTTVEATFSRFYQETPHDKSADVLFSFNTGPSVVIRKFVSD